MTKDEKCELLEKMGFTIQHLDSNVVVDSFPAEFDFSATKAEPWAILYSMAQQISDEWYKKGEDQAKLEIRMALGLPESL